MEKVLDLPLELIQLLNEIYKKSKELNPKLTEKQFFINLINEGLEPYLSIKPRPYLKDEVKLCNDIKLAVRYSGKTQTQVAKEIGIDRTYLQKIISGKNEPSVALALLIVRACGYPKFEDIFYLEPIRD